MPLLPFPSIRKIKKIKVVAALGFDPRTFGLWAQHASPCAKPLQCYSFITKMVKIDIYTFMLLLIGSKQFSL